MRSVRRRNHSRHLPQMQRLRAVTTCSLRRQGVVSCPRPDQTSNPFDASHHPTDTCIAAIHPERPKDKTIPRHLRRGRTAIKARQSRAGQGYRTHRSHISQWCSRASGLMRLPKAMHTHATLDSYPHTFLPDRAANPPALDNQNKKQRPHMIRWAVDGHRMRGQKSAGGRWGNHIIADPMRQSFLVARPTHHQTETGHQQCSPFLIPPSVHPATPAVPSLPTPNRAFLGVSLYQKKDRERVRRAEGRSRPLCIVRTEDIPLRRKALRPMEGPALKIWFVEEASIT